MEAGIIYTKDKKDIEVFFLKPQLPPSEWLPHPTEENTWIVDKETAEALIEDISVSDTTLLNLVTRVVTFLIVPGSTLCFIPPPALYLIVSLVFLGDIPRVLVDKRELGSNVNLENDFF